MELDNQQNITIATMQKDIEYIKTAIDKLTVVVEKHIDECEKKYANKWVEGVLKVTMGTIGLAVIGALMALILV